MKDIYVSIDGDYVRVDINKNGKTITFSNDLAVNYIKQFYHNDLKRIVKHNNKLFLNYHLENVIINNYDTFCKNMYAISIFEPMFSSCPCFVDKDNIDKAKKNKKNHNKKKSTTKNVKTKNVPSKSSNKAKTRKKVKRVNKYDKKTIAASLLVSATLGVTTFGFTSDMDKSIKEAQRVKEVKSKAIAMEIAEETARGVEEFAKEAITTVPATPKEEKTEIAEKVPVKEEKKAAKAVGETIYIDYDDRSETTKAINAHKYEDVIGKYANMYGLDEKLMLALATQERGEHGTVMDAGGATGLMQIQNSVWRGASLKAYNFDTNSWEVITVDESKLSDLDYNVKVGCMVFQSYFNRTGCNVFQTVQAYNMGINAVNGVVEAYSKDQNKSIDTVRKSQGDLGWTPYLDAISFGDRDYLTHVLSYCGNNCNLVFKKPASDQLIKINITSELKHKTKV